MLLATQCYVASGDVGKEKTFLTLPLAKPR
jgi:hypothetical protein